MQPYIAPYKNTHPNIDETVYVAPTASVIGDVEIGKDASIWFGCTVRGDVNYIRIGDRTNIQDSTVIHVWRDEGPTIIGSGVTVGHKALLHACTIEDDAFIGMGAVVMDKVVVESGAMVAAGAVVPPGKVIKAGEIWAGSPAKYFRDLRKEEADFIPVSAQNYVELAAEYRAKA